MSLIDKKKVGLKIDPTLNKNNDINISRVKLRLFILSIIKAKKREFKKFEIIRFCPEKILNFEIGINEVLKKKFLARDFSLKKFESLFCFCRVSLYPGGVCASL